MGDGLHQAEHFRNALDRERRLRVAGFENLALGTAHGNTQLVGRHVGQRRDVAGHATLPEQRAYIVENFLQQGVHRRLHRS